MESILINPGLEAIGIIIFEQMNNQELCNCRLVCKVWSEFIDSVKFYHKKILGHELSYPKQWLQSRKEWQYLIRKLKLHGEKESVIKMGLILRYDCGIGCGLKNILSQNFFIRLSDTYQDY